MKFVWSWSHFHTLHGQVTNLWSFDLRTLLNYSKSTAYEELLKTANIKSLEHRRIEQALILVYKSIHNQTPKYIQDMFSLELTTIFLLWSWKLKKKNISKCSMYNTTLATADLVKLCNYNNFKEKKILKTVLTIVRMSWPEVVKISSPKLRVDRLSYPVIWTSAHGNCKKKKPVLL